MGGGGIGGGWGGGGHVVGARVRPHYYNMATEAIAAEVQERGIDPQVPLDGEIEMATKPCNCIPHIAFTVLICTVIFMVVWELT